MTMTATERTLRSSEAAHTSWARTEDRTARTAPARRGLDAKFLREAGGDRARAESLRKAHYARMTRLSIAARRRRATNGANTRPAA
ncbi:hypothetical protein QN239_19275 [Mycolicibacterium sp. Y3]